MSGNFAIGAVAKMTGLTVHNIRVWERRHNAITAERTENGRRIYTQTDINRLTLLRDCIRAGRSISTIAALSDDELETFLTEQNYDRYDPIQDKPRTPEELSIHLIGNFPGLTSDLTELGFKKITSWRHILEFEVNCRANSIDLMICELPTVAENSAATMQSLMSQHGVTRSILIYRFASASDLKLLSNLQIKLLKAPIARGELIELLKQYFAQQPTPINTDQPVRLVQPELKDGYPDKIFSSEDLALLTQIPSRLDCECPKHMSEILSSLNAFEQYSAVCTNKSPADAQLHKDIRLVTASVRAQMEQLLKRVLDEEKIDLSIFGKGMR